MPIRGGYSFSGTEKAVWFKDPNAGALHFGEAATQYFFIMADQFRADALGITGGWIKMPNLDRLAARCRIFDSAFANSVECFPSRLSLAIGLYPHQIGVDQNMNCTLRPDLPNWMQSLRNFGY